MFTGIVEEVAQINKIINKDKGKSFNILAQKVMDDLKVGDSIAVNGVCLTVSNCGVDNFSMDLVEETLEKSNLGELIKGDFINLERAMQASDRFGGHIVQGHVETLGVILDKQVKDDAANMSIGLEPEWIRYCIPKGSITLDGVSLTIASINENILDIALIPHTLKNTTLGMKSKSDTVNIETDVIAKYIDNLLKFDGEDIEVDNKILKAIQHIQYGES
tara:strand:+ start:94 stop:750 length:657 start_codon:yes stop_codon:yes gene_type:complete